MGIDGGTGVSIMPDEHWSFDRAGVFARLDRLEADVRSFGSKIDLLAASFAAWQLQQTAELAAIRGQQAFIGVLTVGIPTTVAVLLWWFSHK